MAVKKIRNNTDFGPDQVYLPSQTPINGNGPPLFNGGLFYVQYGATAAYGNATAETSLFNNTSSTTVVFYTQGSGAQYPASTLYLPPGILQVGTVIYGRITGVVSTTSTPNLTIRYVLDKVAGTVTTALVTTGATITGSGLSSVALDIEFESTVASTGTTGTMISLLKVFTGTTTFAVVNSGAVTVDTTAGYYLDALATWGTASSSNTLTAQTAWVGIRG